MMTKWAETIDNLSTNYPEYLNVNDLVTLGIYSSTSSVNGARRRGNAPNGFHVSKGRIMFRKVDVISWLRSSNCRYVTKLKDQPAAKVEYKSLPVQTLPSPAKQIKQPKDGDEVLEKVRKLSMDTAKLLVETAHQCVKDDENKQAFCTSMIDLIEQDVDTLFSGHTIYNLITNFISPRGKSK